MNKHRTLNHIRAVIFDLDGTLIDSIPTYFQIMKTILETVGLPPAPREKVAEFLTDGLSALEKMIPDDMAERREALVQECIAVGRKISRSAFNDQVKLFEGVPELFSLLKERHIGVGIATSTHRHFIDRKLSPLVRSGLADDLAAVVVLEDTPRRKPAPDPLLACAERMKTPAGECVYVGDAHVDIQAGNAAGMMTIGVLSGLDDYDRLKKENPTFIVGGVKEIPDLFQIK